MLLALAVMEGTGEGKYEADEAEVTEGVAEVEKDLGSQRWGLGEDARRCAEERRLGFGWKLDLGQKHGLARYSIYAYIVLGLIQERKLVTGVKSTRLVLLVSLCDVWRDKWLIKR